MSSSEVNASDVEKEPVAGGSGVVRTDVVPPSNGENAMGLRDVEAVRESCQYIATLMRNFNASIDSLPSETRKCVEDLNVELAGILIKQKPQKSVKSKKSTLTKPKKVALVELSDSELSELDYELKGAKPKIKKTVKLKVPKVERSCVDGNNQISESEREDSESDIATRRRRPNHDSNRNGSMSTNDVLEALRRLDTRSVPKPEKYSSESGYSFEQFLSGFEEYCHGTFRGGSSLWVGELGRFLTGEMFDAYSVLKVAGDTYKEIKKKLLKWHEDSRETYDTDRKARFTKAKQRSSESLRLYAARLEKTFRLAYPRRDVEHSQTLRKKYCNTVPKFFQKQLQTARSMSLTMNNVEITWSNILALASRQDIDMKLEESEEEVEKDSVWLTSLVKTGPSRLKSCDTSTQCGTLAENIQEIGHGRSSGWKSNFQTAHSAPRGEGSVIHSRTVHASGHQQQGHVDNAMQSTERRTCYYCQRPGHIKSQCRRWLGQCLVCGATDHHIADCRWRRTDRSPLSVIPTETREPVHGRSSFGVAENGTTSLSVRTPSYPLN